MGGTTFPPGLGAKYGLHADAFPSASAGPLAQWIFSQAPRYG